MANTIHVDVVSAEESIFSGEATFVALPGGKLLGGTTTMAGTGGEVKATEAVLYILDLATRTIDWQGAVLPGVQNYPDMILAPNGLVYGVADSIRFFVFDPVKRQVVHEQDLRATLGSTAGQQQSRVFVAGPDQALYMLFVKGIVQVDCATHALTLIGESPVPIGPGGTYLEGRIYFGSGSHVYSFTLPE